MDLTNYFDPVDFTAFNANSRLNPKYLLGAGIEKNTLALTESNLGKVDLVIIGVPFETVDNECVINAIPDLIRNRLYQLSTIDKLNVVDLGNVKQAQSHKGNYYALRDIVDYLVELDVPVLVLGGSEDFAYGIAQAFSSNKFFTYSAVDSFLDVKQGKEAYAPANYLSRIFSKQPDIFQFSLIGFQRHHTPELSFAKTKGITYNVSLGELRKDPLAAEPIFRNSDFISFDFGTFRYSESYGKKRLPNGLSNEDVCQLARYAGLSKRLKALAFFEVNNDDTSNGMNIALAADTAWYFMEGLKEQIPSDPNDEEGFIIHKVEIWQVETPLVFHEDRTTGQWWIKLQSIGNSFIFLACSEQDYIEASHNEIPEIYLKFVQKIDEILK